MRHATYVGPIEELRGQGALVIADAAQCTNPPREPLPPGAVLAQFDQYDASAMRHDRQPLSHGWHAFPATSFRYDDAEPRT